jgi:hypothetical protein
MDDKDVHKGGDVSQKDRQRNMKILQTASAF